jgi:hypothetical protein
MYKFNINIKISLYLLIPHIIYRQRALDDYPELKRMSGNVQKHVTLTSEISKLVE